MTEHATKEAGIIETLSNCLDKSSTITFLSKKGRPKPAYNSHPPQQKT